MKIKINIPEDVHIIINTLNLAGHEAYIVGGCVRDTLMGREPKDWDINTSAKPEEVKKLFPKTYDTGLQHGTVSVRMGKETYEITTYRIDGGYSDFRRPDQVTFTSNLKEDLLRRDFTINAMAYHPKQGIIDYYGGQEDLQSETIRCVGTPSERFHEDALRMLRALRFSAQLDFRIEKATGNAIRMMCGLLQHVSWERIHDEVNKILLSEHPERIEQVYEYGLMQYIIPEWDACVRTEQNHHYHIYNVAEHSVEALKNIDCERVLRWTMLLHDIGKPEARTTDENGRDHFAGHGEIGVKMADRILRRLKFDNHSREKILRLVKYHDVDLPQEAVALRYLLAELGKEYFPDLVRVQRADILAQNPEYAAAGLAKIQRAVQLYEEIIHDGDCVELSSMAINGRDLQQIGYPAGRVIRVVLGHLLEAVLDDPAVNRYDLLMETAKQLKKLPEIQKLM